MAWKEICVAVLILAGVKLAMPASASRQAKVEKLSVLRADEIAPIAFAYQGKIL